MFKDTEIGRIPKDWKLMKLSDVADVKGGKRVPKGHSLVDYKTPFPYIRVLDFKNMGVDISNIQYLLPQTHKLIKQYVIYSNDVYISIAGTVGIAGLIPSGLNSANLTENAAKLCNLRNITKEFLAYVLNSSIGQKQVSTFVGKAQQPKLALFRIEKINLPLPPLLEQKKIAEILSTVDKAIEKVDENIEKTQTLKKGLMQELLTGRRNTVVPDPVGGRQGRREFKQTEIGRIPKEWEVVSLEDVVTKFISGGIPSTKEPSYWNGEIPWITSAYINGFYISSGERHISKAGLENSATNIVPKDNILISTRVGIGKVAINLIDIAISQDLTGALVKKGKAYPNFLCWSFLSPKVQNVLQSFVRGTTIKGIARSELLRIRLSLPPLPEQKKIAEILSTVDKRLELLRKKKEKFERVKKGLMNELLSGRKRVKV